MAAPPKPEPSEWIDISRPLSSDTPVWPGDRAFQLESRPMGHGRLSWFSTTCHVGSHMDAPSHVEPGAAGVEAVPLARLIGPAEVVDIAEGAPVVSAESLPRGWEPAAPRVLLRTRSHPLGGPIGPGLTSLDPELIPWLADHGADLVGIDTPSVDAFDSKDLPAHHALISREMVWLEDLGLENVEPGLYLLAAMPLLLVGADGAPMRAAVRWIAPRPMR